MADNISRKLDSYSYKDYMNFPDDFRCEIVEGFVVNMSPAPSFGHQNIVSKLNFEFSLSLKNKKCSVGLSPLDVFLDFTGNIHDCKVIVQPDLLVVCDKNKINEKGILGVPDLVVEVVSPSSITHDTKVKFDLYEKYEVPEYWLVFPELKSIVQNILKDNKYSSKTFIYEENSDISLISEKISAITVSLNELFDDREII